jgi:predicted short-subunit dehydrogenase-like oxidoreductase (DUF2520 family)
MPVESTEKRLVLVGPGRAGRALARSWTDAGGTVVLFARDAPGAERVRGEVADAAVPVRALDDGRPLAGDVLVLAVPDDAINAVAAAVAPRASCRFAFHLSGALTARALAPLSPIAALGSLHPLRAFSGAPSDSWKDAFVTVEGDDAAVAAGASLCRRMGARPRRLDEAGKVLYHCAATLSAGGVASLVSLAARVWAQAGLDEEEGRIELARLAEGAAEALGRLRFEDAITGPVARRDVETVRLHREALAGNPDLARLYRLLATETLRRTAGRGREVEISRLLEAAADDYDKKPDTLSPKS